ncbi:hypothetical protein KP509_14G034000 [Ceratopteris richardii]|uniref:Uncharacterized protein n=1 Tax=Ceratopteris richardii TaxID=49495 RepID=A0A8T2TAV2_CERRI|nr:hypothetical protein KP509_14G034000 [Ceratopteris richardii]
MERDPRSLDKKRHHPGDHTRFSASKRPVSISEAELDSSIDSPRDLTNPPRSIIDDASHASLCSSSCSGVITSDCSTSACFSRFITSPVINKSSKISSFGIASSSIPALDAENYSRQSSLGGKRMWMCQSFASGCESIAADEECSGVTNVHMNMFPYSQEGGCSSYKETHIVSRREKSSSDSKRQADEAWLKNECGETVFQEKILKRDISYYDQRRKIEHVRPPISYENGPCASASGFMGALTSGQGISHSECACNATSGNILTGSPAYVLSSGRLSLEEEARLGYTAPTIDCDFEEYFSSLML